MEPEEKEREDELYAFQSGEERAGDASESLGLERLRFLFQSGGEFVCAESGAEAENESLKTIQEQVKTRTFSAPTAEKVRHPADFSRGLTGLRCGVKGLPTAELSEWN